MAHGVCYSTLRIITTLCPKKIPDIIDCKLNMDNRILIFFGANIPDTTGHQTTVQVPTLPNVCVCTTWIIRNTRNRH